MCYDVMLERSHIFHPHFQMCLQRRGIVASNKCDAFAPRQPLAQFREQSSCQPMPAFALHHADRAINVSIMRPRIGAEHRLYDWGLCFSAARSRQQIADYLAIPARHDLRQIVERGLNERAWKPYAQKSTTAEQILFLKIQNAYNVVARGQSDLGHDVGHSIV